MLLKKKGISFSLMALLLIALDQLTKGLAKSSLSSGREIPILPHVLELLYVQNEGAAFGVLSGQRMLFFVITVLVLSVIVCLIRRLPEKRRYFPLFLSSLLIFSGAIGNFIDRVRNGYVVDFLYFMPINFPVFNVADIYVTSGCALMIYLFLFVYRDEDFHFLRRKKGGK